MPDVAVNPASQIKAVKWADMIQKSNEIPDFVKKGIRANGNLIQGPAKIKQPENTIPKDWIDSLATSFAAETWEITTAAETYEILPDPTEPRVRRRVVPDIGQGEFGPGLWLTVGPGEKEWSPDNRSFNVIYKVGEIAVLFGETFSSEKVNTQVQKGTATSETRLKSGRALIIIVNRVTIYGVKSFSQIESRFLPDLIQEMGIPEMISISARTLIYSFLHELSAHAGRMNQGRDADHGIRSVEENVTDIKDLFGTPDPEDTHMPQVTQAVQNAAQRLKTLNASKKP